MIHLQHETNITQNT